MSVSIYILIPVPVRELSITPDISSPISTCLESWDCRVLRKKHQDSIVLALESLLWALALTNIRGRFLSSGLNYGLNPPFNHTETRSVKTWPEPRFWCGFVLSFWRVDYAWSRQTRVWEVWTMISIECITVLYWWTPRNTIQYELTIMSKFLFIAPYLAI